MKIKRFNNMINENEKKFYVFSVGVNSRTYRGSIWDTPPKPWIPNNSEFITDFNIDKNKQYITISQEKLHEIFDDISDDHYYTDEKINKLKKEYDIIKATKKYNL